ncbi:MAG: alanine racemase [Bacteroidota bacterium]
MPTLLLDKKKCLRNVERMARKAADKGLSFRPHFKTHQSAEIGSWFRTYGVSSITVSSFRMAAYFVRSGWKDILVAFPFNPHDLARLNALSGSARIAILLDHPATLPFLERLDRPADFYVDIDTGYGRTGLKSEDTEGIENLLKASHSNKKLHFSGFYCHAGHSYKSADPGIKNWIHQKARQDLAKLKKQFSSHDPRALYGDTPNCSIQENFNGIDEITPGNFVFYDLMQHSLGSCAPDDIAVAMACPVTGKYRDPRRMVIHGGAVHFSKESMSKDGQVVFGQVASVDVKNGQAEKGWDPLPDGPFLTGISQEHGIIEKCERIDDRTGIGDLLYILPVHSCLTANLMKEYRTLEGDLIQTINA